MASELLLSKISIARASHCSQKALPFALRRGYMPLCGASLKQMLCFEPHFVALLYIQSVFVSFRRFASRPLRSMRICGLRRDNANIGHFRFLGWIIFSMNRLLRPLRCHLIYARADYVLQSSDISLPAEPDSHTATM